MSAVLPFVRSRSRICDFALHRPASIEDVAALLAVPSGADRARVKVMGGGVDLIDQLKAGLEVDTVIHLGRVKALRDIVASGEAGAESVSIGAGCRHADIASSPHVARIAPALAALCGVLGNVRIRAKGTIGGNLLSRNPAYDLAPALHALGATLDVVGAGGSRSVPVAELASIGADELLTHISVPTQVGQFLVARDLRPYMSVYLMVSREPDAATLTVRAGYACVAPAPLMSVHAKLPEALGASAMAAELVSALPALSADTIVSSAWRRRALEVSCTRLLKSLA